MKSFPGCNRLYEIWHNYPTNPIGSSGKNDGKFCFDEEKNYVEKVFLKYSARKQSGATMYTWTGTAGTGSIEHFILWPQQTQIVIPNYVVSNKQFSFIANDVSTN